MTDLDEIFTLWERFTLGKVPLTEVSCVVTGSSLTDSSALPGGYLAALAHQLETLLDEATVDDAEVLKVIHILRRFKLQTGVKISVYTKCLRSILQSGHEFDGIIYGDFFNLLERMLDPKRNWRDSNCETDSNCELVGSVADFIKLVLEGVKGDVPVPKAAKNYILNLFGASISSNLAHQALCLSEQNSNLLLFELRTSMECAEPDTESVDLLSRLIIRFVHAVHSIDGLPPFPLQKSIQPIIAMLNCDAPPSMKLKVLSLMSYILSDHIGDISSLQMTFLNLGVLTNLKNYLEEVETDQIFPQIVVRFIQRLCFKNQAAKVDLIVPEFIRYRGTLFQTSTVPL